jgi:hypothetical protein
VDAAGATKFVEARRAFGKAVAAHPGAP